MAPLTSNEMREKMVIWRFKEHKTKPEIVATKAFDALGRSTAKRK